MNEKIIKLADADEVCDFVSTLIPSLLFLAEGSVSTRPEADIKCLRQLLSYMFFLDRLY